METTDSIDSKDLSEELNNLTSTKTVESGKVRTKASGDEYVNVTIRIKKTLDNQLLLLAKGANDYKGNKSEIAQKIMSGFFSNKEYVNSLMQLEDNHMLMHANYYLEIFDITRAKLKKLIESGKVKSIKLAGDYIVIDESNIKNIFSKVAFLVKRQNDLYEQSMKIINDSEKKDIIIDLLSNKIKIEEQIQKDIDFIAATQKELAKKEKEIEELKNKLEEKNNLEKRIKALEEKIK